jgi:hypothetical protein
MKSSVKKRIKHSRLYRLPAKLARARSEKRQIIEWERQGCPAPPPHLVKQRTIKFFATRFGLEVLVETGTYYGDMIQAMKDDFCQIYSIELSPELYRNAKKRFEGNKAITLIQGDSGIELGKILAVLNQPALFWLDGHYSAGVTAKGTKDTPIYEELTHILDAPERRHVILIDDARCFESDPAYPSIEELKNFIRSKNADVEIAIADACLRITPGLRPA